MARQLPVHLAHKSALALLLPTSISAPIEQVRREHDRHFARWPPHINLLYPFLASPSEESAATGSQLNDEIRLRIQRAVSNIAPFTVSLQADPPGTFHHSRRSKTVWLGTSTQSVQQLQAALLAEFPECHVDKRPYIPHLSVGQANSEAGAQQLRDVINKSISEHLTVQEDGTPMALQWYIDTVFVIERKGFHDRFKPVGAIDLGKQ